MTEEWHLDLEDNEWPLTTIDHDRMIARAIVVCKEYQNHHIGRRCIEDMLKLAKEKGMDTVKANIYSFNKQSQCMFEAVGFKKTDEEWYEFKVI
ncbi:MAG: GNAT family N-acetyltransferase [Butyrivibrio sp.]|nr:GNAT family N-acetyltransferase [Butyrivibrio sp.]